MIKILLILLVITEKDARECPDNCLFCPLGQSEKCTICDASQNLFMNLDGQCALSEISDCDAYGINGDGCKSCSEGFLFQTDSCEAQDSFECDRFYGEGQTCLFCPLGMKLEAPNSQNCINPEEVIPGCRVYNDECCQKCNAGFRLNLEGKCDEMVGVDDLQADACLLYTTYDCNGCGDSLSYENTIIPSLFKPGANPELVLLQHSLRSVDGYPDMQTCWDQSFVDNCASFSTPYTCDQCVEGYWLDSNGIQCHENPISPKSNCIHYEDSTLSVCTECEKNYSLQENTCTLIAESTIEHCIEYTGNLGDDITCTLCDGQRYFNGTICTEYVDNTNCDSFDPLADKCTSCTGGALSEGGVCLETAIGNCLVYNDDGTCKQCEDFYLSNVQGDTCTLVESDCQCWDNATQKCIMCDSNQLYLDDEDTCSDRNYTIKNCIEYSPDTVNKCLQCQNRSLFTSSTLECVASTAVENCNRYSDASTCSLCDDGYRLNTNDNTCTEIVDDTCINYVDDICKTCDSGYKLNKNLNVCVQKFQDDTCKNVEHFGYQEFCQDCDGIKIDVTKEDAICVDPINKIEGCQVYDREGCKKCESMFIIENNGQYNVCVPAMKCEFGVVYDNAYGTRCATEEQSITGCLVHSFSFNNLTQNPSSTVCIVCYHTHVPVKSCSSDFATDHFYAEQRQIDTFLPHYQCIPREDTNMLPQRKPINQEEYDDIIQDLQSNDTSIQEYMMFIGQIEDNCAYYELAEDGLTFKCQQCVFGYRGIVKESDGMAYVECTEEESECIHDMQGGVLVNSTLHTDIFNGTIPYLYSCHSCTTGIPFIHKTVSGDLCSYDITSEIPSQGDGGALLECRDPTNVDDFGGNNIEIAANCGLGYIIIDQPLLNDTEYPSVTCAACKSGFSPLIDVVTGFITECVEIESCGTGSDDKRFNGCSGCDEGFAMVIDDAFNVTGCKELGDKFSNGFEYVVLSGEGEIDAAVCGKNHVQVSETECVMVSKNNCESLSFYDSEVTNIYSSSIQMKGYLFEIYYNSFVQGCQECENDTQLLAGNFCYDYEDNTNCVLYDDRKTCLRCDDGFIVNSQSNTCITQEEQPGCALYGYDFFLEEEKCLKCYDGLEYEGRSCIVQNCDQQGDTAQICDTCVEGYQLKGSICVEIPPSISNCWKISEDGQECEECYWGYFLIGGNCYQLTTQQQQNINTYKLTYDAEVLDGIYVKSDLDCKGGYQRKTIFDNSCEFITEIPKCSQFNYETTPFSDIDQIQCIECEKGYLQNGECVPYTIVPNCSSYSTTSDTCEQCIEDFVIDIDNNTCIQLILGIAECVIYDGSTNANSCKRCNTGYYVNKESGACEPNSDPDNNNDATCLWYSDDNTCGQCIEDHQFDDNGHCIGDGPLNCLSWVEYNGSNICTECKEGFVEVSRFDDANLIVECVGPEEGSNCLYLNSSGTQCSQCLPGYALLNQGGDNIICVEVTEDGEIIENCDLYGEFVFNVSTRMVDINCNRCNRGTVKIDIDEPTDQRLTECRELLSYCRIQQNCYLYHNQQSEKCKLCKDGYFLSNGKCNRCGDFENCAVCDPVESNICYVCKPGKNCWVEGQELKDASQSSGAQLSLIVFYTIMALFF